MTRPTLHVAVAGQKSKASDYNDNFDLMMDYLEDSIDENRTYVSNVLSIYQTVNTLPTQGTVNLTIDTINKTTIDGSISFALPSVTDSYFHQIYVFLNVPSTFDFSQYSIDLGTDWGTNRKAPTITAVGKYNIGYEYDGDNWVATIVTRNEAV
jgi:hypothetical protein